MTFPVPNALLEGAILHTIVHAIAITKSPTLHYELQWNDKNYIRHNSMGTIGIITFKKNIIVGAFSDTNSNRHFAQQGYISDWMQYFKDAPDDVFAIARDETLMYMLEDYEDKSQPVITTAFWGDKQEIYSNDKWQIFVENGGHLVQTEWFNTSQALMKHQENWEMKQEQIQLAHQLYLRKLKHGRISLTKQEYDVLIAYGVEGLTVAEAIFNSIGIILST